MSRSASPSSPGPSTTSPFKTAKPQRGVSIFPTARVARIIKADRDVEICSKEATFLISIATELFIKKLTDEAYTNAKLDKRKHVFYKDLSRAVQQNEYLEFLKDAIPTPMALSAALEARQDKLQQKQSEENMILEGTLQDEEEDVDDEEEEEDEEDAEEDEAEEEQGQDDQDNAAEHDKAPQNNRDEPAEHHELQQQQSAPKSSKKASPSKSKSKSKPAEPQDDADRDMDQDDD